MKGERAQYCTGGFNERMGVLVVGGRVVPRVFVEAGGHYYVAMLRNRVPLLLCEYCC